MTSCLLLLMVKPEAYLAQWCGNKKDWTMHKHTHAYTVAFRNGCHRHSWAETTSTPKLQLFLFALSVFASEWESTKTHSTCFLTKNICTIFFSVVALWYSPSGSTNVKKIPVHDMLKLDHKETSRSSVICLRQIVVIIHQKRCKDRRCTVYQIVTL